MRQRDLDAVERLRAFGVERRHTLGLRQQDVAKRSGVSLAWVGMLEAGKLVSLPRKETLLKYAKGLLLPAETQGMLYNFLELLLSGIFDRETSDAVALGHRVSGDVMNEAVKETAPARPRTVQLEQAPDIFHDHEMRSARFQQAIAILSEDLHPDDARLAEAFLKRLYDNVPVSLNEPLGHSGPRRRGANVGEGE